MYSLRKNTHSGFSLIELMIAVALVGILGMVAYPSYVNYVERTNRTDAMETLTEIMNQQQKFALRQRRYATDLTELGYAASPVITARALYSISAAACAGSTIQRCVILTAAAQGTQAGDGAITLNSRGEKTWNGNAGWFHRE